VHIVVSEERKDEGEERDPGVGEKLPGGAASFFFGTFPLYTIPRVVRIIFLFSFIRVLCH
jgi:hypothetical protein